MASGQGNLIEHGDYNSIKAKVDAVFGTGSGDSGYGQTVTSSVKNTGDIISHDEWVALRNDMVKARQHQTGVSVGTSSSTNGANLVPIYTGTLITEAIRNQFNLFADTLTTNRFSIGSNQYTTTTSVQSKTTEWNGTIVHSVSYTATDEQFRLFFNAGGFISTKVDGTFASTTAKDNFWAALFTGMGTISMNYTQTQTSGYGTGSSIGYYDLTTTDQLIYVIYGSDLSAYIGTEYQINKYEIYAKKNNTTVTFTINISDVDIAGTDINISAGTINSKVLQNCPSGSNVSVSTLTVSTNTMTGGAQNPQYLIVPNVTSVKQGDTITYTITTQYVADGTTLAWANIGTAPASAFSDNSNIGVVTISANTGTITRVLNVDIDNSITIKLQLYKDVGRTIVAGLPSAITTVSLYGYVYSVTLSATYNYNLRTSAIAAGWDPLTLPLLAYVTVNDVVGSSSTSLAAFTDAGTYPDLSFFNLTVNSGCYIVGAGGNGGSAQSNGGGGGYAGDAGGLALDLSGVFPEHNGIPSKHVTNNGTIGGGGGGGGGGFGSGWPFGSYSGTPGGGGGGGAGAIPGVGGYVHGATGFLATGGAGGSWYNTGGAGGNLGLPGEAGPSGTSYYNKGGVDAPGGAGGSGGTAVNNSVSATWFTGTSGILGTIS